MKQPKRNYFDGIYVKQEGEECVAIIPSLHRDAKGREWGNLQIIVKEETYQYRLPIKKMERTKNDFITKMGNNIFTIKGVRLNIREGEKQIKGKLTFGATTPLRYDIMGPFHFVPFLQCRHSVFSLFHRVDGRLYIDKKKYDFNHGIGYIEGDRGYSFPKKYIWTQASLENSGCIMLSIATIPMWHSVLSFRGCIGVVFYEGKEYRFATYLGVKLQVVSNNYICIRQGNKILQIWKSDNDTQSQKPHTLLAPIKGEMKRNIKEHLACNVRYRFLQKGKLIFDIATDRAGFEAEWKN